MRVLVTGAAGFIGFHVSRHLLARGDTVLGIDSLNDYYDVTLKHARLDELNKDGANSNGSFTFKQVDFSDHVALDTATSISTASSISARRPASAIRSRIHAPISRPILPGIST
jgi:UDP-glucuronate 4-epimerase